MSREVFAVMNGIIERRHLEKPQIYSRKNIYSRFTKPARQLKGRLHKRFNPTLTSGDNTDEKSLLLPYNIPK